MARTNKPVKRTVRGRSSKGSKKVLRSKEPVRVEDKPESDHEVRTDALGVQGIDPGWADIAINAYLSALSFSASQGVTIGMSKENVSQIGLSYFVRLYDSLSESKSAEFRRQRLTEILDLYFLAGAEEGGRA